MRIEFATARARRLSLTSLIDVIFLLLLFFMLSSTFTRFSQTAISGGLAGKAAGVEKPDVLVRLDQAGLAVNGTKFASPAEAQGEFERLAAQGAHGAVMLVRGGASSQQLIDALEAVRRAGLDAIVAR